MFNTRLIGTLKTKHVLLVTRVLDKDKKPLLSIPLCHSDDVYPSSLVFSNGRAKMCVRMLNRRNGVLPSAYETIQNVDKMLKTPRSAF